MQTEELVYLRSASEEQQYEAVTAAIISRLTDSLALSSGLWLLALVLVIIWSSSFIWVADGLLT